MWQPTSPVLNAAGKPMSELNTWTYLFAKAWEALEPDPEDLDMYGFFFFGPAVAEKHGDEDPAVVAKRLFPEAGEYHGDLYPGDEDEEGSPVDGANREETAPPPEFGLRNADVPF